MTRGLSFSEAFWDADIQGTYGWDTLCRRMKDGKKVCAEVSHYLKDRADAETKYSKALLSLTRKADGKEETGVLGESWRALKAQTEIIANIHEEAANTFTSLMEELNRFSEEQSKSKKQTEENVKKYIANKKSEYTKTMSLKKAYEEKCKDFNNAEETLKTVKSSVTTKKNELEKAETKMTKCQDSRDNADMAYRSGIDNLESARKNWEQETESGCRQYEELESKRIDTLRDLLWRITNVDSLACLKHDECSENVRTILEKCDINNDLQDFIENNKSGSKRPDPIPYENYYNGKSLPQGRNSQGSKPTPTLRPPPPSPTRPPPRPNFSMDDGVYATVDPAASTGNASTAHSPILLKVAHDHHKTSSAPVSELSVNQGDIVEYIGESNIPGLVKVKHGRVVGCLPKSCLAFFDPPQTPHLLVTI